MKVVLDANVIIAAFAARGLCEALLDNRGILVEPVAVDRSACRDPGDPPILGLAVAAGADYIVSGDKDLLVLKHHGDIPRSAHPGNLPKRCAADARDASGPSFSGSLNWRSAKTVFHHQTALLK